MKTKITLLFLLNYFSFFGQENRSWEGINSNGEKISFIEISCIDWIQTINSKKEAFKKIKDQSNGIMLKNSEKTLFLTNSNCQQYSETNKKWDIIINGSWKQNNSNSKTGCISGDCINGYGVYKYTDAIYSGYFKNSKRNGIGELRFNDCITQTGSFSNDSCCNDMYTEENPSNNTLNFLNSAKNSNDYYNLRITKNDEGEYYTSNFYAMVNNKYFSDWGSSDLDTVEFPNPEYNLKKFKSNEYFFGEPRFFNDGKYMIICVAVDGVRDGLTKSWFKVIEIKTGNIVKTYGNITAPIKGNGNGRLEIKDVIDHYMVFEYDVEGNQGVVLRRETKVLDLNTTTYGSFTNKHPIYNDYCKLLKIDKNGNVSCLQFLDSLGVNKKSVCYENCDLSVFSSSDIFHTVIGRETAKYSEFSYYTKRSFIETYNSMGVKIDSNSFDGYVYFSKHPSQFKYLASYNVNGKSIISEFSLLHLDSLIETIKNGQSKKTEVSYYSPTGKYIIIGKAIYLNKNIHFGILGTPYFLNNDNSIIFEEHNNLYYYNLITGKLGWILNKQRIIQGPTTGGVNYSPTYNIYCAEGYLMLIGRAYGGDKFHLRIKIENLEQSFDDVVEITNSKLKDQSLKIDKLNSNEVASQNVNSSIENNQTRTCTYKFTKPKLTVTWNDNRIECCNPKCRYWACYSENKKSNLEKAEIEYLNDLLKAHLLENNCDDAHKLSDCMALNEFVIASYYGLTEKNSVHQALVAMGMIGFMTNDVFETAFNNSSVFGYKQTNEEKIKKLKSKNKVVNIYNVTSKYCSKECKEYCEFYDIKCFR